MVQGMRWVGRGNPGWKQEAVRVRMVQSWSFSVVWMASAMRVERMDGVVWMRALMRRVAVGAGWIPGWWGAPMVGVGLDAEVGLDVGGLVVFEVDVKLIFVVLSSRHLRWPMG